MDDLAHEEMLAQTNELYWKFKAVGKSYLPDCVVPALASYLVSTCSDIGVSREDMHEFFTASIDEAYNLLEQERINKAN